jgi:hypothetical protein
LPYCCSQNRPKGLDAIRDFRRIAGSDVSTWPPALEGEFRRAASQREVYLQLQEVAPATLPESAPIFDFKLSDGSDAAAQKIRAALGIKEWPRSLRSDPRELLNRTVTAIEDMGIQIIHTRDVDISEMRGLLRVLSAAW